VIALTGARQVGKTTLAKALFADKPYLSLEDPDVQFMATHDPRAFLSAYPQGAVFDEVQRVPHLFSYLQAIVDGNRNTGQYILLGSNNFLLNQAITQSLAGRVAYCTLPAFSLAELGDKAPIQDNELIFQGFYPPIYDQSLPADVWHKNYVKTYIERDVRQIKGISDLLIFGRFMSLLAGRCGQELNMSALSTEVGADVKTVQSWIGILESSFLVYLLPAYHRNFNKTIIKRPKLYFTDVGLACSLLRIYNPEYLENHPLRGALFENMVVMEFVKRKMNTDSTTGLYYWRDKTGHEIDLIIEEQDSVLPIEIKSAQTISGHFFKNLTYWKNLSGASNGLMLYAGKQQAGGGEGVRVANWREYFLRA
jgi:predicted AAA+ superfamily ATPase